MGGGRRPDLDNVIKIILDGLNQSGIWNDDRQVAELTARAVYCNDHRVVVVVHQLRGEG